MSEKERSQALVDRVIGRVKQAAGDLTGNRQLQREGREDESRAEAERELAKAEGEVTEKAREVGRREAGEARQTTGQARR